MIPEPGLEYCNSDYDYETLNCRNDFLCLESLRILIRYFAEFFEPRLGLSANRKLDSVRTILKFRVSTVSRCNKQKQLSRDLCRSIVLMLQIRVPLWRNTQRNAMPRRQYLCLCVNRANKLNKFWSAPTYLSVSVTCSNLSVQSQWLWFLAQWQNFGSNFFRR